MSWPKELLMGWKQNCVLVVGPQRLLKDIVNKERPLGSNKYERWVEADPNTFPH